LNILVFYLIDCHRDATSVKWRNARTDNPRYNHTDYVVAAKAGGTGTFADSRSLYKKLLRKVPNFYSPTPAFKIPETVS
jgi:hypothetical protein